MKNYSKERTGHGFNTNLQVTVGREETPGRARGVPSFKAPLWSQRGASHAVSTQWADCFPLTNGTRVADKLRAPESDCTAGAGNLRIWWVAFLVRPSGTCACALRSNVPNSSPAPKASLAVSVAMLHGLRQLPKSSPSRPPPARFCHISHSSWQWGLCESPMEW